MLRNIEIKATVRDVEKIVYLASQLSKSAGEEIPQHDIFYNVPHGRLKLRRHGTSSQQSKTLVYYDRPDCDGPKLSEYILCDLSPEQSQQIDNILCKSIGIKGELKKTRLLFLIGQTRVHIDSVDGLGNFMELEVVLNENQSVEEGQAIAKNIQTQLGVPDEDLITGAYIDLVLKNKSLI